MNKKELKIRKLLGYEDYHLYSENDFENWKLFKKYKNFERYISNENKPIMTSETHTIDDLYKFAKKHHKIDESKGTSTTLITIAFINLFIAIVNLFLKINYIRGFIMGINLTILIISFTKLIIADKNMKVFDLECEEEFERFKQIHGDKNENK